MKRLAVLVGLGMALTVGYSLGSAHADQRVARMQGYYQRLYALPSPSPSVAVAVPGPKVQP